MTAVSMIELVTGVILLMLGIFRFTVYKRNFTKSYSVAGFSITPEVISIILFIVGFVLVLLFIINFLQPLFYHGRDLHPGIT